MSETPAEIQPNLAEQLAAARHDCNTWRRGFFRLLVAACLVILVNCGFYVFHVGIYKPQSAVHSFNVTICGSLPMSASASATAYLTTHGVIMVSDALSGGVIPTGTMLDITYRDVTTGPFAGYFAATGLAPATAAAPGCNMATQSA